MTIALVEITDDNIRSVAEVRVAPSQERFVTSVADSLAEADGFPAARPWYRAGYLDGEPIGFVC